MGTEAGEPLERIIARKEAERSACGGIFYWGIGSAIGPAVAALVAVAKSPDVLFSPIKSPARVVDVAPSHVVRWSGGRGLSGEWVNLPEAAHVTSRWDPLRPGAARYALVCQSDRPLELGFHGELSFEQLCNLRSGAPVGASQVTAVVRRTRRRAAAVRERSYPVALRARIVWPYLIRLASPSPSTPLAQLHASPELQLSL
jgi:hypothetical protein